MIIAFVVREFWRCTKRKKPTGPWDIAMNTGGSAGKLRDVCWKRILNSKHNRCNGKRQTVTGPATIQLPKSAFTVAGKTNENGRIIAKTLQVIGKDAASFRLEKSHPLKKYSTPIWH